MTRLLKCEDVGLECYYICADSEEELLNRATQYAQVERKRIGIPSDFRDRVLSLSRPIGHC
jgi:predicted small metal-binding protein